MTLKEAIKKAVTENDATKAGRIVENLRFKHGLDYKGCARMFENCAGCSEADFEALMYESDMGG